MNLNLARNSVGFYQVGINFCGLRLNFNILLIVVEISLHSCHIDNSIFRIQYIGESIRAADSYPHYSWRWLRNRLRFGFEFPRNRYQIAFALLNILFC